MKPTKHLFILALLALLLLLPAALAQADGTIIDSNNKTVTITGDSGFPVTFDLPENEHHNVTIHVTGTATYSGATANPETPGLDIPENVTLTLKVDTTLTLAGGRHLNGYGYAGIHVPETATFIYAGPGTLTANGGSAPTSGAGIGGNSGETTSGTILLNSGTVNATGGSGSNTGGVNGGGSGIGGGGSSGGSSGNGGTIIIGSVILTAQGGNCDLHGGGGSGIGGGGGGGTVGTRRGGNGGTITILAGATLLNVQGGSSSGGGGGGSGIGGGGGHSGGNGGSGGNITIHAGATLINVQGGNCNGNGSNSGGGSGIGGGGGGGSSGSGSIGNGGDGGVITIPASVLTFNPTNVFGSSGFGGDGAPIGKGGGNDLPGASLPIITSATVNNVSSTTLSVGDTATFSVVASGTDLSSAELYHAVDGINFTKKSTVPGATDVYTYTPTVTLGDAGVYYWAIKNTAGTARSPDLTLYIHESFTSPTINYTAETLTFQDPGNYTFNGGTAVNISAGGTHKIDELWITNRSVSIKLLTQNAATYRADSKAVPTTIPARPKAPTTVTKTDETASRTGGSITGLTTAMQYKLKTASTWTPSTGIDITNIPVGTTYEVRFAATSTDFASASTPLTIAPYTPPATPPSTPTPTKSDPEPAAPPSAPYQVKDGELNFDTTLTGVTGDDLPVVITATDENGNTVTLFSGTVGKDGKLRVNITESALSKLGSGSHTLTLSSPGNTFNNPIDPTAIGDVFVPYKLLLAVPSPRDYIVLPDATTGPEIIAILSGNGTGEPVTVTYTVGARTYTQTHTGNGTVLLPIPAEAIPPVSSDPIPLTASIAKTDRHSGVSPIGAGTLSSETLPAAVQGEPAARSGYTARRISQNTTLLLSDSDISVIMNWNPAQGSTGGEPSMYIAPEDRFTLANQKAANPVPQKNVLKVAGDIDTQRHTVTFAFSAQEMARLAPGHYAMLLRLDATKTAPSFGPVQLMALEVPEPPEESTAWTIPEALTVSLGTTCQLVSATIPDLNVSTSNKKVATISKSGVLTPVSAGKATITVASPDGTTLKCTVTVTQNRYARKNPLMLKGKAVITSSTKQLYYQTGTLKAEIFLLNRTGRTVYRLENASFDLYRGDTLIYTHPIGTLTFKTPLRHKRYHVYRLTITDEMLPGVSAKPYNLGSGEYTAVIRATNTTPVATTTLGAVVAKSQDAIFASTGP